MKKPLSLRRSRHLFKECLLIWHKGHHRLSPEEHTRFAEQIRRAKETLDSRDRALSSTVILELHAQLKTRLPKTWGQQLGELCFAIVFALVFATIVRQVWFEPMEIPTGSMRPTLREQDRLIVTKTNFGINIPLLPKQFYFDSSLLKFGQIIVFTVENMDVADAKTRYFYLFPGYKRFVKRCMGKGGDLVYFYGGQVWGIDHEGNELKEENGSPHPHIPFITFSGKTRYDSKSGEAQFYQMNQLLGRIKVTPSLKGYQSKEAALWINGNWVPENPGAAKGSHDQIVTLSDFWGMGNYGMVRLLAPSELPADGAAAKNALAYLQIFHHANLSYPQPQVGKDNRQGTHAQLQPLVTYLPLHENHLKALWQGLYTSRFHVKNGKGYLYTEGGYRESRFAPDFTGVPDGCYEFFDGIPYSIDWGGVVTPLPYDHPLYEESFSRLATLFNTGIELNTLFMPRSQNHLLPARYAYFNQGELYVMGAKIATQEDPSLIQFVASEQQREEQSTSARPYLAFVDHGPPLKEGKIDREFLEKFGLRIPDKNHLALGDNYAMSADSRQFGFVPEENLEGSPWFLLWPAGNRWGVISQPGVPGWHLPSKIVCALALVITLGWTLYQRRKLRRLMP